LRRPFDRYRCGGVLRDVRLGRRDPRMLRWQATANSLRFFVAPAIGGAYRLPCVCVTFPLPCSAKITTFALSFSVVTFLDRIVLPPS